MSRAGDLDRLAAAMTREARTLAERAGVAAARVARPYLDRMLDRARSLALGSPSSGRLVALRRELRETAGEMAWRLAGAGNRDSWAFPRVVEALRASHRAVRPVLALVGVEALPPDVDAVARALQDLDGTFRAAGREMADAVADELVRMTTRGADAREVARRLTASGLIEPLSGMNPVVRAATIADTEVMRVYRQTVEDRAARAPALTHRRMVGPVTASTSRLCRTFVGRVMSIEDWRTAGWRFEGEHGGRGMHPRCRHGLQPMRPEWLGRSDGDRARTGPFANQVAREHDADSSLPEITWDEFKRLPASERIGRSDRGWRLVA